MIVSSNPDLNTHIRWYESGFWKPRIDMVLKQVESWKGKKVLDMGCGIGTFAIETAKRGAEVIAVDSFDESIRISKEMVKKYGLINKVKVIRANILTLPLQANTFDVIIIADVIEHIVDSSKLLDEIKRVGKEGSIVICTTKNALSFYLFLGYLVHRNIGMIRRGLKSLYRIFNRGNKKIDNRNPYITYVGHVNEYDPFRLRMDFKRKRFKIIYHATYSWNWRSDWKNLNRIFRPFFSSLLFKKIQNKLLGLFLGHDQIIVAKVSMKNNKKKILFNVSGSGVLSSNKGGAIEKIVANQVNYLSEKFEVIVFGQLSPLNENVEVVSYNRRMYLNKKSILNDVLFLIHGFWKMRKIEADIIISTHERNFVLSLLYAKIKRKPLIAWELDHVFWTPPWTTIKRFYHRLCLKSNLIITMSSEQKRRMIKQSIDHNKIKVIYNPVDTNKYCPLGKKSNTNYILYVAKFTERKNQLLLLKAFNNIVKKYDNLKLIFVGPKSGAFTGTKDSVSEYYVQCLNYIKSKHLEDKVIFYENLEEEELIKLYQESTLFVFPSLEEGFGMTLLEAMACSCVCISNNIEPMAEILGKAGVLIDMSDVDLLSKKIIFLLDNYNLREKFGKLARERAVSHFSSNKIHKQFKEILVKYLGEHCDL